MEQVKYYQGKLTLKTVAEPECLIERIVSIEDAAALCVTLFDPETIGVFETSYVVALNTQNKPIWHMLVGEGSSRGTVFCPKKTAQFLLLANANSAILTHNHPSGNTQPSDSDINLTRQMAEALKTLDIKLLDHIIVSGQDFKYLSLSEMLGQF